MAKILGKREDSTLILPDVSSFSTDELLLARVIVGLIRAGGTMFTGRLLECQVGRLLDAQFPTRGTSSWDLRLPSGTRIEVRSGRGSFSLKGTKEVDLWVFVDKAAAPLRSFVGTSEQVRALARRAQRLSVSRAETQLAAAFEETLAATVNDLAPGGGVRLVARGRGQVGVKRPHSPGGTRAHR